MTFDAGLWANTQAEGFTNSETPPPGDYRVTISEAKFAWTGEAKDKPTIIVEYRTQDGKVWADVKQLTSEGRVKSAKILMSSLGLDPDAATSPDQIHAALKSLEGKFFRVGVKQSTTMKTDGSGYYLNTEVYGALTAQAPVPAPVSAAPVSAAPVGPDIPVPAGLDDTPIGW